nr:MAG TPA: hypothetical protein [Caudoviricetes sp.]
MHTYFKQQWLYSNYCNIIGTWYKCYVPIFYA